MNPPQDEGSARDAEVPEAPDLLGRVLELIRLLRIRCPWDAAQTPRSLLPYLLEESHEVADAVADGDDAALQGELGDLLLNVAFQIVLAEEREAFSAADVVAQLDAKMRRRHPHLFAGGEREEWEVLKARERGGRALLDDLPRGLDPLSGAFRIQERVSGVGFDWDDHRGALVKVREELEETAMLLEGGAEGAGEQARTEATPGGANAERVEEELGDLLFAVVNLARLVGAHPAQALRRANRKFTGRFGALESLAAERGLAMGEASLEELDALWDEVKSSE